MTAPIVFGTEIKFVPDATTTHRQLNKIFPAGSDQSVELDTVDYQIPAGKDFWIYRMQIGYRYSAGTLPCINFYYGPTANSTVGATNFTNIALQGANDTTTTPQSIEFVRKIEENNYITLSNPYGCEMWINIFGVECDN